MQMKEANAWTAAQLGQIKMAGDEAKAKEAGPHGADEWVVRATKADAKKAGKKVCVILRRLGCFFCTAPARKHDTPNSEFKCRICI